MPFSVQSTFSLEETLNIAPTRDPVDSPSWIIAGSTYITFALRVRSMKDTSDTLKCRVFLAQLSIIAAHGTFREYWNDVIVYDVIV